MIMALIIYTLLMVAIAWIEHHWLPLLHQSPMNTWLIEHVYEPLLRLSAIIIFVIAAYPALFALRDAPTLVAVLAGQPHWLSEMMNLLLVLSLLIPLLPVIGQLPALVLPIQAVAVSTLLFHWTATTAGISDYSLWPGWIPVAGLVLIAILGMATARPVALHFTRMLHREDWKDACTDSVLIALQIPAILVYTNALGTHAFSN